MCMRWTIASSQPVGMHVCIPSRSKMGYLSLRGAWADIPLFSSTPHPHRGFIEPKSRIHLTSQPCGLQRIGKTTIVGTMDNKLSCYAGRVGTVVLSPEEGCCSLCLLSLGEIPVDHHPPSCYYCHGSHGPQSQRIQSRLAGGLNVLPTALG